MAVIEMGRKNRAKTISSGRQAAETPPNLRYRRRWRPLLPLNHLRRRFRIDLKEQIFKARAKSPTVCPPKFVYLEFTGKFYASEEWLFREVSESID